MIYRRYSFPIRTSVDSFMAVAGRRDLAISDTPRRSVQALSDVGVRCGKNSFGKISDFEDFFDSNKRGFSIVFSDPKLCEKCKEGY